MIHFYLLHMNFLRKAWFSYVLKENQKFHIFYFFSGYLYDIQSRDFFMLISQIHGFICPYILIVNVKTKTIGKIILFQKIRHLTRVTDDHDFVPTSFAFSLGQLFSLNTFL